MTLDGLLEQYRLSHQNIWNQRCHSVGIPMILVSLVFLLPSVFTSEIGWWLFSIGWGFQFLGHAIERSIPEFLKNPVFLLVGPIFFAKKIQRKFKS